MAIDFQIQEMIHQNSDGVIFQALDKQTGHLVALRRFFLPDLVITRLKEKEENGKTVFENGLDWLKALDVPHLQKVVAGGFDELDDTPYFVTEWVDGRKLDEAHEQGIFSAGEGEVFNGQARAVLTALPMEVRHAVYLEEERILVSRDDSGSLLTTFLWAPRRYFGAKGGMEFNSVDRQEVLESLKKRFPAGEVAQATPIAGQVTTPIKGQVTAPIKGQVTAPIKGQVTAPIKGQVTAPIKGQISSDTQPVAKSSKTSAGGGLLWGALGALVALLGVGGWLVFKGGDDEVALVAEKTVEVEKIAEELAAKDESDEEASEVEMAEELEGEELEALAKMEEEKLAAEAEAKKAAEEEAAAAAKEAEEKEKAEAMALAKEEEAKAEENAAVSQEELAGAEDYSTWKDIELFKTMNGEEVKFRGKVSKASRSRGKGSFWYLDFGNYRERPFVLLLQKDEPEANYGKDWVSLEGEEVFVTAEIEVKEDGTPGKRGSGVTLRIKNLSDIRFEPEKPPERVYEYGDLDDLRVVSTGEKVIFEGVLKRHQKNEGFVYLFFEDGISIVGRFDVGGPLSNRTFANKLKELEGKKVRLVGVGASDENPKIEAVIQLSEQSGLTEAVSAETESDE